MGSTISSTSKHDGLERMGLAARTELRTLILRMSRLAVFVLSWFVAGVSLAEGANVWDGPYVGPQLGSAANNSCSQWATGTTGMDVSAQTVSQSCATRGVVGGIQVGENIQYKRVFWGMAADLDLATATSSSSQWISKGGVAPAGAYVASGRLGPDGFLVLAPRVGYAGGEWAPYLRAGALVALGGRDSALAYTPPGAGQPSVSFKGGRSFNAISPVVGGGIEWGLNGPWTVGLEYMHATLGKGSNATATCAGTVLACEGFAGVAFQNFHNALTFNMFRITANYYFDFW